MSKQRRSKLDQFAAMLADMDAEKKTIAEMITWLRGEGVTCSPSTLSEYLELRRQSDLQEKLLAQIASGSRQCKEVENQFGKNPAPELETLIKLHRVLIMQLSTRGNADPEFLRMADSMLRTAMEYTSGKTKAAFEQEKIQIRQAGETRLQAKLKLEREKFETEFCEKILDQATREAAERIAGSSLSQAEKIAAMRRAAFADVDALQASGQLKLPQ